MLHIGLPNGRNIQNAQTREGSADGLDGMWRPVRYSFKTPSHPSVGGWVPPILSRNARKAITQERRKLCSVAVTPSQIAADAFVQYYYGLHQAGTLKAALADGIEVLESFVNQGWTHYAERVMVASDLSISRVALLDSCVPRSVVAEMVKALWASGFIDQTFVASFLEHYSANVLELILEKYQKVLWSEEKEYQQRYGGCADFACYPLIRLYDACVEVRFDFMAVDLRYLSNVRDDIANAVRSRLANIDYVLRPCGTPPAYGDYLRMFMDEELEDVKNIEDYCAKEGIALDDLEGAFDDLVVDLCYVDCLDAYHEAKMRKLCLENIDRTWDGISYQLEGRIELVTLAPESNLESRLLAWCSEVDQCVEGFVDVDWRHYSCSDTSLLTPLLLPEMVELNDDIQARFEHYMSSDAESWIKIPLVVGVENIKRIIECVSAGAGLLTKLCGIEIEESDE